MEATVETTSQTDQVRLELLRKQDEFIFAEEKYTAMIAGLGSGKTMAGCLKGILKCKPGQDGAVIAPTFPMLRDVTEKTFLEILDRGRLPYIFSKTEGKLHYNGADVLFRSADAPERLRGVNLNWAYLDEAALMSESVWKVVLGRLRVGERPSAWITTTPAGFNWVYKYWAERADPSYRAFNASTRENHFLPPEYLQDLIANYSGEYAKQEIEGEFVAFEGLVYSEFFRSFHVVPSFEIPSGWKRMRSIDYGYTNPFVCLWGAADEDGRLYVYDEHYRRKGLIRDHAQAIKARGDAYTWTVADHDAQDNAEMAAAGIQTRNAQKDVVPGVQKLKARLLKQSDGRARLYILETCPNTIKEFGMYRWAEATGKKNEKEEPVKQSDHAMDALRYMVMELDNERFYVLL